MAKMDDGWLVLRSDVGRSRAVNKESGADSTPLFTIVISSETIPGSF